MVAKSISQMKPLMWQRVKNIVAGAVKSAYEERLDSSAL